MDKIIEKEKSLFASFVWEDEKGNFGVYLVNPTEDNYKSVKIFTGAYTSVDDDFMETSKIVKEMGPMPTKTAIQIDQSDFYELDFVIWYEIDCMSNTGHFEQYAFHLPKGYGIPDEMPDKIPFLNRMGMIIPLDIREGKPIDEIIKTVSLEPKYYKSKEDKTSFSQRFDQALVMASELHRNQSRKGTDTPYIGHLLSVAGLVIENGGTEEEAIAALLHDAVEDQGGAKTLEIIRQKFGEEVADIVWGCTDTDVEPKPPWRERKEAHIKHLKTASLSVKRVCLADKYHNLQTIFRDYRHIGEPLWQRFNGKKEGTLWYYRKIFATIHESDYNSLLLIEYNRMISILENVAWSTERKIAFVECEKESCGLVVEFKHLNESFFYCKTHKFGVNVSNDLQCVTNTCKPCNGPMQRYDLDEEDNFCPICESGYLSVCYTAKD